MTVLDDETRDAVKRLREEYNRLAELPDSELAGMLAVLVGVRKPAAMRAWDGMRHRWFEHTPSRNDDTGSAMNYRYGWEQGFAAAAQVLAEELRIPEEEQTWIGEALS